MRKQNRDSITLLRSLIYEVIDSMLEAKGTTPTSSGTSTSTSKSDGAATGSEERKSFQQQALDKARDSISGPALAALKKAAKGPGSPASKVGGAAETFANAMISLQDPAALNPSAVKRGIFKVGDDLEKQLRAAAEAEKKLADLQKNA